MSPSIQKYGGHPKVAPFASTILCLLHPVLIDKKAEIYRSK